MRKNVMFYWDRYSTQADAMLFGFFFGVGALVQLIFRLWLDLPALLVTAILLVLMGWYAFLIQANSATKTGSDRSGDTLYFLGFIFTTITLGIALFKIGSSDRDFATAIVLYDLGIGIATTIWGLVLRVIFSLMRTGTEEIENRTLSNLNQRARSLNAKLTHATQMAEETTVVVQQVLEETRNSLQRIASNSDANFAKVYDETIERHRALISRNTEAMQGLCEKIETINVPADIFERKLNSTFERLSNGLDLVASRISSLNVPENSLKDMFASALNPLSQTLVEIDGAMNKLKERVYSIAELDYSSLSGVSDKFKDLIVQLDNFRKELDIKNIDSEKFNNYIEVSGNRYVEAVEQLAAKLDSIILPEDSIQKVIDGPIEGYRKIAMEASNSFVENANGLKEEISELKTSIAELSSQISITSDEFKKTRSAGALFDIFRR